MRWTTMDAYLQQYHQRRLRDAYTIRHHNRSLHCGHDSFAKSLSLGDILCIAHRGMYYRGRLHHWWVSPVAMQVTAWHPRSRFFSCAHGIASTAASAASAACRLCPHLDHAHRGGRFSRRNHRLRAYLLPAGGLLWQRWRWTHVEELERSVESIIANGNYIYQSGFIGQPVFNCLTINSITLYYKLESMRFLSLIPILVQFLLIAILFTWPFSMPLIFAYYIFFYRQ